MKEVDLANIKTELTEAKVAINQVGNALTVAAERIHEIQQELYERRVNQRYQDGEIADLTRRVVLVEKQISHLVNQLEKLMSQKEYGASLVAFEESLEDPDNF